MAILPGCIFQIVLPPLFVRRRKTWEGRGILKMPFVGEARNYTFMKSWAAVEETHRSIPQVKGQVKERIKIAIQEKVLCLNSCESKHTEELLFHPCVNDILHLLDNIGIGSQNTLQHCIVLVYYTALSNAQS